jgi:hypothetical protein
MKQAIKGVHAFKSAGFLPPDAMAKAALKHEEGVLNDAYRTLASVNKDLAEAATRRQHLAGCNLCQSVMVL